jgi:hypothetical protein
MSEKQKVTDSDLVNEEEFMAWWGSKQRREVIRVPWCGTFDATVGFVGTYRTVIDADAIVDVGSQMWRELHIAHAAWKAARQ